MPIPVWLPFALQGGSMVASGIGNYLEGKNQESYSKKVMRMQQEAAAKRQKAEGAAGAANIWFGLAGRQQMQPIYQKMPDIDPYESSGTASLFKGLGTGLSYASTAVGAYDSMSKLLATQAREAGARSAAAEYIKGVSEAPAAVILRPTQASVAAGMFGDAAIDPGIQGAVQSSVVNNQLNHHTSLLTHLKSAAKDIDVPEYKGILGLGGAQEKAYIEGYKTTLGASFQREQDKLIQAQLSHADRLRQAAVEQTQTDLAHARLRIQRQTLEIQKSTIDAKTAGARKAARVAAGGARREISTTMRDHLSSTPYAEQVIDSKAMLNALQDLKGVNAVLDPTSNKIRFKIDEGADIDGTRLYTFLQKYFRFGSPEAIHEADLARFQSMGDGFLGEIKVLYHNIRQGKIALLGPSDKQAVEMAINPSMFKNRKYFTNNTIENMMNTVLVNQQFAEAEFKKELNNVVAFNLSQFNFDPGELKALGFNNDDHFLNYYTTQMNEVFNVPPDINQAIKSSGEVVGSELIKIESAAGLTPSGKVAPIYGSTMGNVEFSRTIPSNDYKERAIQDLRKISTNLKGQRIKPSKQALSAFKVKYPGAPTNINDAYWTTPEQAVSTLDSGGPGVHVIRARKAKARHQSSEDLKQLRSQVALDFLKMPNTGAYDFDTTKNAFDNFRQYQLQDANRGFRSVDGLQDAMRLANYKWGKSYMDSFTAPRQSPGLGDPNTISDAFAPSTRVQNTQQGIAGLGGFFGVGGLYTDTIGLRSKPATEQPWYPGTGQNYSRLPQFQKALRGR